MVEGDLIKDEILLEKNNRFLTSLKMRHLEKIRNYRNKQMDVLRQNKPLTKEDQERWYTKLVNDNQVIFSIMLRQENKNKFIGYCGLTYIDYENKRAELSFLVDPKRVKDKKTYKTDFLSVLEMLCKYGFEELKLNKIFTETYSFRKSHIHILELFGFIFEGRLREHIIINGKHVDSLMHSLLISDWEKKHGSK